MIKKSFYLLMSATMAVSSLSAESVVDRLNRTEKNPFRNYPELKREAVDSLRVHPEPPGNTMSVTERMMAEQGLRPGIPPAYSVAPQEAERPLTFTGFLQYASVDGRMILPYGFYSFSTENGLVREPYANVEANLNFCGAYYDNRLVGVSSIPLPYSDPDGRARFYEWDSDTWEPTSPLNRTVRPKWRDISVLAADPSTGKFYSFMFNDDFSDPNIFRLAEVNMEDGSFRTIKTYPYEVEAKMFAIDGKGNAFVITTDKKLSQVDLTSGEIRNIGVLDFDICFALQSMTWDPLTDKFYLCASEGTEDGKMLGRLCELNVKDATTRLIGYLPENEEYTCLHVISAPIAGQPGRITDFEAHFKEASSDGQLSFKLPTTDPFGNPISGDITYCVQANGKEIGKDTDEPGQRVFLFFNEEQEGNVKFVVTLENSKGKGERNVTTAYRGADTPMAKDVILSIDKESGMANLSWTSEIGIHGGYVAPGNRIFDVIRQPGNVSVATGISECSFSESLQGMEYEGYFYEVVPSGDFEKKIPAKSNLVRYGKAADLPYKEDFETPGAAGKFEIIDANADGATWGVSEMQVEEDDPVNHVLKYIYSPYNPADDWALTAPVSLKEGMGYEFSFKASAKSSSYPEVLEVKFGKEDTPDSFATIMPPTTLDNPISKWKDHTFRLPIYENGDYRFGFHALSEKFQVSLFVDDINVKELCHLEAPAEVESITGAAAFGGQLAAVVEFDAPKKDFLGNELKEISKIELIRSNGEIAAVIDNVSPGEHCVLTDKDAVNGINSYTVMPYNGKGHGLPKNIEVYVGEDSPYEPVNLTIIDNMDGTATLSWEAPSTTGPNGAYVDPEGLWYNVYRYTENGPKLLEADIYGTSYKISSLPQTGEQDVEYFGVDAANELGQSKIRYTSFVTGGKYEIPFSEHFVAGNSAPGWHFTSTSEDSGWNMYSGDSFDGDNWLAAYLCVTPGNSSTLRSGKISVKGASSPKLIFSYYEIPGAENTLKVFVHKNGGKAEEAFCSDFKNANGKPGWRIAKIDLQKYSDSEYLTFDFEATVNDSRERNILIDDLSIRNVKPNDLSVELTSQMHATRGDEVHLTATVHNIGENPAENYFVDLYVNGNQVASAKGINIESFNYVRVKFSYITGLTDTDMLESYAEVRYEADDDNLNNVSSKRQLKLIDPLLPKVSDLRLENKDDSALLLWNEASTDNEVTDSFEGYESFVKENFGDWKVIDSDNAMTVSLNGINYPYSGEPIAFMTFDFSSLGIDISGNPDYQAEDGTQFLAAFRPRGNRSNDDWLISPELSGEAQTISLYAKNKGAIDESIEIRCSENGTDKADFSTLIEEVEIPADVWTRFEFEIPAGTRHFAVHCNSAIGGMLMLDKISYKGKKLTLIGYNVYRDGQLIGTANNGSQGFSDKNADNNQNHVYNVTALFEEGESGFSNDVYLKGSGVEDIFYDSESEYYDLLGRKLNNPTSGVTIMRQGNEWKKIIAR